MAKTMKPTQKSHPYFIQKCECIHKFILEYQIPACTVKHPGDQNLCKLNLYNTGLSRPLYLFIHLFIQQLLRINCVSGSRITALNKAKFLSSLSLHCTGPTACWQSTCLNRQTPGFCSQLCHQQDVEYEQIALRQLNPLNGARIRPPPQSVLGRKSILLKWDAWYHF